MQETSNYVVNRPSIKTEMNANQEHSSKTGSGNFNTNILQSTTENFKNHDVNEEQDRYMDRMLEELVERKITGERKIAESDAQSLYRLIEADDDDE